MRPILSYKRLAPVGAALSAMTTMLAFDISCIAASVYGIGHHPRFLMNDSPREGDMQGPLFRRLFEIVHEMGRFLSKHCAELLQQLQKITDADHLNEGHSIETYYTTP